MADTPAVSISAPTTQTAPITPEIAHAAQPLRNDRQASDGDVFTPDQQRKLMEWSVEDKKISPEAANEMLAQNNLAPLSTKQDPNTFEAQYDRNFAPAKSYQFELPPLSKSRMHDPQAQAEQSQIRSWLVAGEFGRDLGNGLARLVEHQQKMIAPLKTDQERSSWKSDQYRSLHSVWKENFHSNLDLTQKFIDKIEAQKPGVVAYLKKTGMLHSAQVIHALHGQAERLVARKGSL